MSNGTATRHPATFLITGAGSGIGRGLAIQFASLGYRIIATDLNLDSARATVAQMSDASKAVALELNVTNPLHVKRAVDQAERIDVLINNAGLQHVAPMEEFSEVQFAHMVDVMMTGAFSMCRAVIPMMRSQGSGRIINMGSIHSLIASPYKSAYVAAKHGLVGLTKTTALETASADITANAICPAYVRTPLVERQIKSLAAAHDLSEERVVEEIMLKPMPKKAFVTVEEIADTILFLSSASARNITGQTVVMDGGWTVG